MYKSDTDLFLIMGSSQLNGAWGNRPGWHPDRIQHPGGQLHQQRGPVHPTEQTQRQQPGPERRSHPEAETSWGYRWQLRLQPDPPIDT